MLCFFKIFVLPINVASIAVNLLKHKEFMKLEICENQFDHLIIDIASDSILM